MDDDNEKSVIEKMVDKVNDAVANIINTASTPAMRAGARSRSSRSDDQRASLHSGNDRRDDRAGLPKKTVAKAVAPKKSAKKSTKKKKAKKTATKASKKAAKSPERKKTSAGSLGCRKKEGEALRMADTDVPINFDTPAVLKKWPSLKNERISKSWGANPYLVADGTLDECIRQFMSKPASQHHLYEIHTAPQSDLVSAVLSAEHIVELARLRDFL